MRNHFIHRAIKRTIYKLLWLKLKKKHALFKITWSNAKSIYSYLYIIHINKTLHKLAQNYSTYYNSNYELQKLELIFNHTQ
jgi:hypothetical protein